jgi:uncharacterized RDD family membrane protein YckC
MKKAGFFRRLIALWIDSLIFCGLFWVAFSIPFFFVLYETVLISQWKGQTIGKKIMGIKVVSASGDPMDWVKALVRSLSRFLSALLLFLGYFWMLWDDKSQTWHDKLADTYVVEA